MRSFCLHARRLVIALHEEESAQDVIEYALLASLLALGAVIGINGVSSSINTAFTHVHSKLHSHIGKHLGWYK
ncbi:MAG: Flp family type IVb pilin [Acidobacteria bacterium]|nr:MAG: Flp family type IVb pilin [Acidobacteriota bacterium]